MSRTDAMKNTQAANDATAATAGANTSDAHTKAGTLHRIASDSHSIAGDDKMKDFHSDMAAQHFDAAGKCKAAEANNVTVRQPGSAAQPGAALNDSTALVADTQAASATPQPAAVTAAEAAAVAKALKAKGSDSAYKNADGTFAGPKPFDSCVLFMQTEAGGGHSADSAKAICGKIAADNAASANPNKGAFMSQSTKTPQELAASCSAAALARMRGNEKLCGAVKALKASLSQGGYSLNDLNSNVRDALCDITMLNTPAAAPTNCPMSSCWVTDLVAPVDDNDNWTAIVNGADGKMYAVDFDVDDGGEVTVDGDPQPVEKNTDYEYVNEILMTAAAGAKPGLEAGGPGSGRRPSGESEATQDNEHHWTASGIDKSMMKDAKEKSDIANKLGDKAVKSGLLEDHAAASSAHNNAAMAHQMVSNRLLTEKGPAAHVAMSNAAHMANFHSGMAYAHRNIASDMTSAMNGGDATAHPAAILAAGTSDGAQSGHATRKQALADMATEAAGQAGDQANAAVTAETHQLAADAHQGAYDAHKDAYAANMKAGADDDTTDANLQAMLEHKSLADHHKNMADELKMKMNGMEGRDTGAVAALHAAIAGAVTNGGYPEFPFRKSAIEAGDFVGHPFRGNQYGEGGGSAAGKASKDAHEATKGASTATEHKAAAVAHRKAAIAQTKKGNTTAADYHRMMANYHDSAAGDAKKEGAESAASGTATKSTGKAVKSDSKEDHEAAAKEHVKAAAANKSAGNEKAAGKHAEMAEHHKHMSMGRIPSSLGREKKKKKEGAKASNSSIATGLQAKSNDYGKCPMCGDQESEKTMRDGGELEKTKCGNCGMATDSSKWQPAEAAAAAGTTDGIKAAVLSAASATKPTKESSDAEVDENAPAKSIAADAATKVAETKSDEADELGTQSAHEKAAAAHTKAHDAHMDAYAAHTRAGSDDTILSKHMNDMANHKEAAADHQNAVDELDACEMREAKKVRNLHNRLTAKNGSLTLKQIAIAATAKFKRTVTEDAVAKALVAHGESGVDEDDDNGDGSDNDNNGDAFDEGYNATSDDNPYDEDSDEGQQWQAGYDAAHQSDDDLEDSGIDDFDMSAKAIRECHDELKSSHAVLRLEDVAAAMSTRTGKTVTVDEVAGALVGRHSVIQNDQLALNASASRVNPSRMAEITWDREIQASARAVAPCEAGASAAKAGGWSEPGSIMYFPSGLHTITPSQGGRPVTVTLAIESDDADIMEEQRKALESMGKPPFFSIQHGTEIAGFWPKKFYWDTKLDATGKMATGVWADGEWTGSGKRAKEEKDFRSFSPTFFVNSTEANPARVVCNVEARANMGALENDPAFGAKMSPLWARNAADPAAATALRSTVRMVNDSLLANGDNPSLSELVAILNRNGMNVTEDDAAKCLTA